MKISLFIDSQLYSLDCLLLKKLSTFSRRDQQNLRNKQNERLETNKFFLKKAELNESEDIIVERKATRKVSSFI